MATNDILKRYLDAGMTFVNMTQQRAEAIVKDLVRAGELQQSRAQKAVDEIVERSRKNTEDLMKVVRREVRSQLGTLGIATKDDIARLEAKINRVSRASAKKGTAKKAATAKKA